MIEGESVSGFFREDLLRMKMPFTCLLPEWICNSMSSVAINCCENVHFYPVDYPKNSKVPLQIDWHKLIEFVEQNRHTKMVILLAHPLGYIDPGLEGFVHKYGKQESIHLYLDMAQSYGTYSSDHLLDFVEHVYISFNGNKLIRSGGALKIINETPRSLKERISKAIVQQKQDWKNLCRQLYEIVSPEQVKASFFKYSDDCHRSSLYRTAISFSTNRNLVKQLEGEGFGQTVHPNPQDELHIPSDAYLSWLNHIFLLFSVRRKHET